MAYRHAFLRTFAVAASTLAVVVAVDMAARKAALAQLPVPGTSGGSLLGSPVQLMRVDHVAPPWFETLLPAVAIVAGLAVVLGFLVPKLAQVSPATGIVAAAAGGLYGGGLLANYRSLRSDGFVLDVVAVPVPGDPTLFVVLAPADLAALLGLAIVTLLTVAAAIDVLIAPRAARTYPLLRRTGRRSAGQRAQWRPPPRR